MSISTLKLAYEQNIEGLNDYKTEYLCYVSLYMYAVHVMYLHNMEIKWSGQCEIKERLEGEEKYLQPAKGES